MFCFASRDVSLRNRTRRETYPCTDVRRTTPACPSYRGSNPRIRRRAKAQERAELTSVDTKERHLVRNLIRRWNGLPGTTGSLRMPGWHRVWGQCLLWNATYSGEDGGADGLVELIVTINGSKKLEGLNPVTTHVLQHPAPGRTTNSTQYSANHGAFSQEFPQNRNCLTPSRRYCQRLC